MKYSGPVHPLSHDRRPGQDDLKYLGRPDTTPKDSLKEIVRHYDLWSTKVKSQHRK